MALAKQGNLTDEDIEGLGPIASSKLLRILLDDVKQPLGAPALDDRVLRDFTEELPALKFSGTIWHAISKRDLNLLHMDLKDTS